MSFYAQNFIYDGVLGSEYGLRITSQSDGLVNVPGASVELITQNVYRNPKNYLLGVKDSPVLKISIEITVEKELTAGESSVIARWLFGQKNYKKLQIVQPDMENIYFNCIFTNPQVIKVGNIIRGYSATAECDSPFAWEFPKKISYSFTDYSIYETVRVNNSSDLADYYYPVIGIRTNIFGGNFEIINRSENERLFGINNLEPNDTIIIDNMMQRIYSLNTGKNYIESIADYDYTWFRYVPNANILLLKGNIESLTFLHEFPKKYI